MTFDLDAMARRIADKVLDEYTIEFDGGEVTLRELAHRIRDGDLVPVVRCRNCKWYDKGSNESDRWMYCKIKEMDVYDDYYCATGEQKE